MRSLGNCPNCAAPIVGQVCEYCGTVFHNHPDVELIEAKMNALHQQKIVKTLYEEALIAMRMYGSGCVTPNEARELIGLSPK